MIIHYKLTKSLTRAAEELLELIAWQYNELYTKTNTNSPESLKALSDFYKTYKQDYLSEEDDSKDWLN